MSEQDAGHVPGQLDLAQFEELREDFAREALRAITRISAERKEADAELTEAVAKAQAAGVSWERIGEAAGVTRQAAWQRWGKR